MQSSIIIFSESYRSLVIIIYGLSVVQVLGAWGLGWEVWMDGMEITQFTYFQQVNIYYSYSPQNIYVIFLFMGCHKINLTLAFF